MSLQKQLRARLVGKIAIVGVGNPYRGDDAAGCRVAEGLKRIPNVLVFDGQEVPENFLGPIVSAKPDAVLLIDAVDLGAEPGAAALLERDQVTAYLATTHRLPLSLVMEFLEREARADVMLLAIQPRQVTLGYGMSKEVEASVARLGSIVEEALLTRAASESSSRTPEVREVAP